MPYWRGLGKGPRMGWFLEYTLNTHRVTFPVKNLGIQMMQADTQAWDLGIECSEERVPSLF